MNTHHSLYLIRLHFNSPMHLAKGKPGSYDSGFDVLHSDTLKAALFAMAVELFDDEVTEGQTSEPAKCPFLDGFRISSGFPFWENELFFPKPMGVTFRFSDKKEEEKTDMEKTEEAKKKKLAKGIRFVGRSIFEKMLADNEPLFDVSQMSDDGDFYSEIFSKKKKSDGMNFEGREESDRFVWKTVVEQRVIVPRGQPDVISADDAGDAKPYFLERLYFREGAGLFFLLDCADPALLNQVLASLRSLGENGVGMDRNTGNGHFEIEEPERLDWVSPAEADYAVSLSLFCPTDTSITAPDFMARSNYALFKRGGWVTHPDHSSLRKQSVYMFAEGSVFPLSGAEGKLVNLRPKAAGTGHPMWRDGRPIFLPMKSSTT